MSRDLTIDEKIDMVRKADPKYRGSRGEAIGETVGRGLGGRLINREARAERRQQIATMIAFSKGTKLDLHDPLRKTPGSEAGSTYLHPFRLESKTEGNTLKWRVNAWGSTITDGTNGDALDITGLDMLRTATGDVFVRVQIDIDTLETTSSAVAVEGDGSYADEVEFDVDGKQIKANLLIGRAVLENDVFKFIQAINSAHILTHGILNGAAVRVFQPYPIHPTFLELP